MQIHGFNRPQQERSADTVVKVVSTLESLLATRQFETITTSELAETVEIKVQSLYKWFEGGKDTVLALIYYSTYEEITQRWLDSRSEYLSLSIAERYEYLYRLTAEVFELRKRSQLISLLHRRLLPVYVVDPPSGNCASIEASYAFPDGGVSHLVEVVSRVFWGMLPSVMSAGAESDQVIVEKAMARQNASIIGHLIESRAADMRDRYQKVWG